ncbi:unnamed protein product [Litomosoides sigmodontis]|uniref:Uncharacterized protein n=1 Tax=Litomosoides sigmodontis TaxID=42156 RepID=A0A3P6UDA0_LITSI|nr:unnamed protein product [Litomosoides sigmodontis]
MQSGKALKLMLPVLIDDCADPSQYCHMLRCSIDELCVVGEKTARCIKNDKLHAVDGVHIDFASGKLIDHHADEAKSNYRVGRIKLQHKHNHFPRHYEHVETTNYECDEKNLHSVGGRLLQWFSEMHKVASADSGLPLHSMYIAYHFTEVPSTVPHSLLPTFELELQYE